MCRSRRSSRSELTDCYTRCPACRREYRVLKDSRKRTKSVEETTWNGRGEFVVATYFVTIKITASPRDDGPDW